MHVGSTLIIGAAATAIVGAAYFTSISLTSANQALSSPATTTSTSTTVASAKVAPSTTTTSTTAVPAAPVHDTLWAQNQLTDAGYWLGTADGKGGELTKQATMAFQKLNGLSINGNLDEATLKALENAQRPTPVTKGTTVEIDKTHQVIIFAKDGKAQWVLNTSTGTERTYHQNGITGLADTPVGDYKVFRQVNRVDPGPLGDLYRPKYFRTDGIAVHGAPVIPGYADSHGCARVTNAAMDFIWANDLMPMGVDVSIYGTTPSR